MKKIDTHQFGEIEVDEKKIVTFQHGIPAFEDEHEFVIIPSGKQSISLFTVYEYTTSFLFDDNSFCIFPRLRVSD